MKIQEFRILRLVLKGLHHPALPIPLKNFLMEIRYSFDSLRRLHLLFPVWSLFYWLSFCYVALRRQRD